jgi:segregation and condensation protein B
MPARPAAPARQFGSVSLRYVLPARWELASRTARLSVKSTVAPRVVLPPSPLARDERLARLEAVLFLSREPVTTRRLAQLAHLADGTEARTLIRRLNRYYDDGGSAFRAEEVGGGFQLMTRPQFGPWLRRLYRSTGELRLSAPGIETLAIVAYLQPVMRSQIEAIRGVDCGEIVRQLMERDLLKIVGRSADLGRPYLYGTTKRFLQAFGLRHLDDLPRAGVLRARPQINLTPPTGDPDAANSRTADFADLDTLSVNPHEEEN